MLNTFVKHPLVDYCVILSGSRVDLGVICNICIQSRCQFLFTFHSSCLRTDLLYHEVKMGNQKDFLAFCFFLLLFLISNVIGQCDLKDEVSCVAQNDVCIFLPTSQNLRNHCDCEVETSAVCMALHERKTLHTSIKLDIRM